MICGKPKAYDKSATGSSNNVSVQFSLSCNMPRRQLRAILTFCIVCSAAVAQVGNKCIIALTGDVGVCKISTDCPVVEEQAKRALSFTKCGFYQLNTPIVCCPLTAEADPLIVFPSEEPPSVPLAVVPNSNLRISEQKCEKYSRAITGLVQGLPLITDIKPIDIPIEMCEYNSVPLIVGGKPASPGEYPFMAAIGFNTTEHPWKCGGTLISERYVLTAAHCTYSRDFGKPTLVRLGELDLSTEADGSQHRDYRILNTIVHPNYRYSHKYHDIALVQTDSNIEFTKFIRPACLYTSATIPESTATATGWGRTDFAAQGSDQLMKVTLNVYDNVQCEKTYQNKNELPDGITSNMLCAGELKGKKDTCQGDSGGPLHITQKGNRCKFYVIGVTSFGKSCGVVNTPAIYTKVSSYVDWIEQTIW